MEKLKTIWLPRGKRVYVWNGVISTEQKAYEQVIAITPTNAGAQNTRTLSQSVLLLKETEEINNWARLGAKLYFVWFTLILTVNGLATGWLFTYRGATPPFARLIFLIFMGLNLTALIVTFLIRKYMLAGDARIQEVLVRLGRDRARDEPYFPLQSPVPLGAVNTAFAFTGIALLMLLIFWTILEFWPHLLLT